MFNITNCYENEDTWILNIRNIVPVVIKNGQDIYKMFNITNCYENEDTWILNIRNIVPVVKSL
jgi:hypothetical protein